MKSYGWLEVWLHTFLTSRLDGGEWSASCTDGFNPIHTGHPKQLLEDYLLEEEEEEEEEVLDDR